MLQEKSSGYLIRKIFGRTDHPPPSIRLSRRGHRPGPQISRHRGLVQANGHIQSTPRPTLVPCTGRWQRPPHLRGGAELRVGLLQRAGRPSLHRPLFLGPDFRRLRGPRQKQLKSKLFVVNSFFAHFLPGNGHRPIPPPIAPSDYVWLWPIRHRIFCIWLDSANFRAVLQDHHATPAIGQRRALRLK